MKKALQILKKIFVILVAVAAVGMMVFTIISVTTFDQQDRSIFGYKAFIVMSESMSRTDFTTDDLILVKNVKDPSAYQEGDIISFVSQDPDSRNEIVTHKIRRAAVDEYGNPGYITYGTTTDTDDRTIVTYPFILGQYRAKISGVGAFLRFLKSTLGYLVCIFIPFLILIAFQGIRCVRLFRQYKSEQQAEMAAERAALEAERAENRRMMDELMELKAKLGMDGENSQ